MRVILEDELCGFFNTKVYKKIKEVQNINELGVHLYEVLDIILEDFKIIYEMTFEGEEGENCNFWGHYHFHNAVENTKRWSFLSLLYKRFEDIIKIHIKFCGDETYREKSFEMILQHFINFNKEYFPFDPYFCNKFLCIEAFKITLKIV